VTSQRTENDTWDLATSVGATATMVAAGRARATKAALLDDRFAEPLVRAVGVDFFTRWATGELAAADVDVPGAPWACSR
jgi:O-methyltransferase involved in polyketide biosynthesis